MNFSFILSNFLRQTRGTKQVISTKNKLLSIIYDFLKSRLTETSNWANQSNAQHTTQASMRKEQIIQNLVSVLLRIF